MTQSPSEVIMIRPASFGFNAETSQDNVFMNDDIEHDADNDVAEKGRIEFDAAVETLRNSGIVVHVFEDTKDPKKPDSIFPNNWFSTHESGLLVLYPMMAETRRTERRADLVQFLKEKFKVTQVLDLSSFEGESKFLEGSGSIVLDHICKKAYACRSSRTDQDLLQTLCSKLNYDPIVFDATDLSGVRMYHTNVMMWIGTDVAAVCLDSITDETERKTVLDTLNSSGRTLIHLSFEEVMSFGGNCIELKSKIRLKPLLAISCRASRRLSPENRMTLKKFVDFIECDVDTIEHVGGGGIRCMIAGIHLPKI